MAAARYPSIAQAIGLLALFVGLEILLSVVAGVLEEVLGFPAEHPAVHAAVALSAAAITLRRGLRKAGTSFRGAFPFRRVDASLLLPMALTIIGLLVLGSEADNLLRLALPPPPELDALFARLAGGKDSLWGSVLFLVVVAPWTEELLVRGLILRGFLRRYSLRRSICVSALLFGVMHFNPWQLPGAIVLGVVFAWWYVRTGSLVPCLFGHALNNATVVLLTSLDIPGSSNAMPSPVRFQPFWFDLLGLLATSLGIWMLVRAFSRTAVLFIAEAPPQAPPAGA